MFGDRDADFGLDQRVLLIGLRLGLLKLDASLLRLLLRIEHRLALLGEVLLLRGLHQRFGQVNVGDHHRNHLDLVRRKIVANGALGGGLLFGAILLIRNRRRLRDLRSEDAVDLRMNHIGLEVRD